MGQRIRVNVSGTILQIGMSDTEAIFYHRENDNRSFFLVVIVAHKMAFLGESLIVDDIHREKAQGQHHHFSIVSLRNLGRSGH